MKDPIRDWKFGVELLSHDEGWRAFGFKNRIQIVAVRGETPVTAMILAEGAARTYERDRCTKLETVNG